MEENEHIDAVGRGEFHVMIECFIHESLLDHSLTIIKYAIYFQCSDVLT